MNKYLAISAICLASIAGLRANSPPFSDISEPETVYLTVNPAIDEKLPEFIDVTPRVVRQKSQSAMMERLMVMTVWGEARGTGEDGMRAVAHVIKNRLDDPSHFFGKTIAEVVWKRAHFTCWRDHNRELMKTVHTLPLTHPDRIRWEQAKKIVHRVLTGRDRDVTGGATYYHANGFSPYWLVDMSVAKIYHGHSFYRPKHS